MASGAVSLRFFVLGLLAQQSMSGYDIQRFLKSLSWLIGSPSPGSLYPILRALREEAAALNEEPHQLTHYVRDLANEFHTYYNAHQFLVDDAGLRDARLKLILAVRQVLRNGLNLLGVSAPESM